MQRIKIRFLADYQHLCKIPPDSSQTLHDLCIHNAITCLNSAVTKMNVHNECKHCVYIYLHPISMTVGSS